MLGTVARDQVVQLAELLAAGDAAALLGYAQALEERAATTRSCSISWRRCSSASRSGRSCPTTRATNCIRSSCWRGWRRRIAARGRAAVLPDRHHRPARPGAGARSAHRLSDDADPHAGIPACGRQSAPALPARRPLARAARACRVAAGAGAAARAAPRRRRRRGRSAASRRRPAVPTASAAVAAGEPADWPSILAALDLQGAPRQLAANCVLLGREGATRAPGARSAQRLVRTRAQEEKLAQALSRYFGSSGAARDRCCVRASTETPARSSERTQAERRAQARSAFEADPSVEALKRALRRQRAATTRCVRPSRSADDPMEDQTRWPT